jgi:hypothetical protein
MDKAMITLLLAERDETTDLEVPVNVTAERLLLLLRSGLPAGAEAQEGEVLEMKEPGGEWAAIGAETVLAEANVRDGVYMRIRPKHRPLQSDADLPVAGWKPLF